jgi:hypothetical protein
MQTPGKVYKLLTWINTSRASCTLMHPLCYTAIQTLLIILHFAADQYVESYPRTCNVVYRLIHMFTCQQSRTSTARSTAHAQHAELC